MPKNSLTSSITCDALDWLDRLTFEIGDAVYDLAATLAERRGSVNRKSREIEIQLTDAQDAARIVAEALRGALELAECEKAIAHLESFVGMEVEQ